MLKLIWPFFILLVLAQWWVPAQMIWHKESTLRYGTPYRFRSEPVDPNDPFRGKYITLNFNADTFRTADKKLTGAATVYVTFATGKNGFAVIKNISTSKPSLTDYLETTITYRTDEAGKDSSTIHISYPFEKFYLDEYKAPEAERRYNAGRRDTAQKTYALVYLLNGDAVVKNVFVNDTALLQTGSKSAVTK
jgi:uncharacterized membrane-anchored protein